MFIYLIRIITAILLLFALGKHPYSYYIILRIIVFATSFYLLYVTYNSGMKNWMTIFIIIVLLFNPILPIHFNKGVWAIIDISSAAAILVSILYFPKKLSIFKESEDK